jgi:RNA polymerase sigma factor (sigma-70 family)
MENELVKDNLKLVHLLLRKYKIPRGCEYEDMFQEGCIGLYDAAKTYDPSSGYKFSTLATTCIMNRFLKTSRYYNVAKRTGKCISLFTPTIDEAELLDMLPNTKATDPVGEAIAKETYKILMEADELLVTLRLSGMTQADVAEKLGVNQVMVNRKLKKLKSLVV